MSKKQFNTYCSLIAVLFVLLNVFVFCSMSKYAEQPPAFSKTKMSEWRKLKPFVWDSAAAMLDTLLTNDAKTYYSSLDEPYAAIVMERSFGGQLSVNWLIYEWEGHLPKMKLILGAGTPSEIYMDPKGKWIGVCYYRHLKGLTYNAVTLGDSIRNDYMPPNLVGKKPVYLNQYYKIEDSIVNNHYFINWAIGDNVSGSFQLHSKKYSEDNFGSYEGVLIGKDSVTQKISVRITGLEYKNKRVLAVKNPKTGVEEYKIGQTIWELPRNVTNKSSIEPLRY